ncbi:N(2)-acetyl-L-2,4-diaminobutanoate deacetylase DoeB [Sneathiella limimaris]|uniref:N(2)-acetyl-L-2,4-diaminobutanoate deacetylase DoeB n=1 Tax=Sneathiella limimaris TaxID=1964213 RepID=UPI00146CEFFE|nr:N(2)-acetyl-L-2,4-diaminobutanoate deacetylase DoeB [Sneathiella limimaris]
MTNTALEKRSKISTQIDLDKDGVQHGHLIIPHSRNDSPWGSLLMPLSVFKNGEGPTVLLTGGNHGDEYEGPIALIKLIQSLEIDKVKGRVIILPALNYPAVKAGTRLSPLDGGNMNRSFPGDADGTITQMIADFVQRFILTRVDAVVDIHAGGKIMSFLPTAVIHNLPDPDHMERTLAAARAFGAPNCLVLEELDAAGMLDTAVEEMGKIFISTELGGGGSNRPETVRIAETGIHDVLVHLGILDEAPKGPGKTRFLGTPAEAFVIADKTGLFEFTAELGERVEKGHIVARIYDLDNPTAAPAEYRAPCDGIVIHRHLMGQINRGDCLAVMGQETDNFS